MYDPEPLDGGHDLSGFESGEPGLDAWLQRSSLEGQKEGTGRTFVWVVQGDRQRRVVAYYTLAAHVIEREQLSKRLGRGMSRQLPAVLLGRLALDRTLHGQGLGGAVLAEAISRVVEVSTQLGVRYLVVDALHVRAGEFYQHYGFILVPDQRSLRLVRRIRPELVPP